jgi:hypothetical protein
LDRRVWATLKDLPPDPLLLILHLWFSEHSTAFGILELPDAYILHDLHWRPSRLGKAWALLEARELVLRDEALIIIPLFLACNLPGNQNVLAGWRKLVFSYPPSEIFQQAYVRASEWVTEQGLAWLQPKINNGSTTKAPPKPSPTLSNSGAVTGEKREEQEQEKGECEREEPDGALRSASPPQGAASLRAPDPGNGSNARDGIDWAGKFEEAGKFGFTDKLLALSLGLTLEQVKAKRQELAAGGKQP